jgi:hypothetical protein
MKTSHPLPSIADEEKTPLVCQLLDIIQQQREEIQNLKDEIARLKHHPRRPKLKPSRLENRPTTGQGRDPEAKRPGSAKRSKTAALSIHETRSIAPPAVPDGARFKGYNDYVVQDIRIQPHNTLYRLEKWETAEGKIIMGAVPEADTVNGGHFGPTLVSFILYQYYHAHVTQPLLHEQLLEYGIEISKGQLNRLLTEEQALFHQEKDAILEIGLQVSTYLQVDDTGARHQGKNGYCTQIGNAWFTWFESTDSKSRLNFLRLLRAGRPNHVLLPEALTYMAQQGLPKKWLAVLGEFRGKSLGNAQSWQAFLSLIGMTSPTHVRIATEGAILGDVVRHGLAPDLVILSDGAGQFNLLRHALCWVHAERSLAGLVLATEAERHALATVRDAVWTLYDALKAYQQAPTHHQKQVLDQQFDDVFTTVTCSETVNTVLERLYRHKTEVLMVLEHPEIPLHNNGSEQAIREYVKRRKVSGGTRSEAGRRSRDTFTSLKQTCRKLKVSFWQYLQDRLGKHVTIPGLADLIQQRALKPG